MFTGASEDLINLLPELTVKSSDPDDFENVFTFDGQSVSFEVAPTKFGSSLESSFTISMWMKRSGLGAVDDNVKQHILCSSDADGKVCILLVINDVNCFNSQSSYQ